MHISFPPTVLTCPGFATSLS